MMEARLIATTDNSHIDILYSAARTCYSDKEAVDVYYDTKKISTEEKLKLIKKVLGSGHLSIAEHINFTFAINGISRACAQQLTRHRHASYSMKSQRYVRESNISTVIPEDISNDETKLEIFNNTIEEISGCYNALVELGCKKEDARAILPNCTSTSLIMTCNLRELIHICNERLCVRAQFEIRELAGAMKELVVMKSDSGIILNKLLVPKCKTCTEFNKCKKGK